MSDAIDLWTTVEDVVTHLRRSPSWSPGSVFTIDNRGLTSAQGNRRPETRRNPPGHLGIRPMSPWERTWFLLSDIPRPYTTNPLPGRNAWFVRDGSYTTALAPWIGPGIDRKTALSRVAPTPWARLSADSKARNNVLKRASQTQWNLLATAGELRETCEMITGMAVGAANSYRRYRNASGLEGFKGNLLSSYDRWIAASKQGGESWIKRGLREVKAQGLRDVTRQGLESFRDKWMLYQMGMRPLAYDVGQACDYLNGLPPDALPTVMLKSGASEEYSYVVRNVPQNTDIVIPVRVYGEVQTHYVLYCQKTPSGMSTATALGLNQGLSTAWELTKLSWLVDYVVDVGGWLQAWYGRDHVSFLMGCKSTIWRSQIDVTGQLELLAPDVTWGVRLKPMAAIDAGDFEREVLHSLPVPGVVPNLKELTGVRKALNAIFALSHLVKG